MKIQEYQKRLEEAKEKKMLVEHKSNQISLWRLISFMGFVAAMLIWLFRGFTMALILFPFLLLAFIILVIIHEGITRKEKYYRNLIAVLNEYLDRFSGKWTAFADGGKEFASDDLPFLADLDIIGDYSLFKYLNVCITRGGRRKLIKRLSAPVISGEELQKRQQPMKAICDDVDFSLDFQAGLKDFKASSPVYDLDLVIGNPEEFHIGLIEIILALLLIGASMVVLVLTMAKFFPVAVLIGSFVIELLFSYVFQYRHARSFDDMSFTLRSVSSLQSIMDIIKTANFHDHDLMSFQHDMISYGLEAIASIRKIYGLESVRKNMLGYLLNGFLPLNVLIAWLYERYLKKYSPLFPKAVRALEDLEVLVSLAVFGQTKENITLPVATKEATMAFVKLKHPLMIEDDCVPNSFDSIHNINIITGSNMSGKTSFLRTIGINLILMKSGAYVNAEKFTAASFMLFTSMRVPDDLSKGISTFYAELLRIKTAIEYAKEGKPMIVLIDEVFRGTNSNDRIQGAISMIERLNQSHVLLFISTHDFELCDITTVSLSNYHFSEHYVGNEIKFDYHLKEGKCLTTNARYLMKLAGIID